MKIFYRKNGTNWCRLYSAVDETKAQVYEINVPDEFVHSEETGCENIICLWDVDRLGKDYRLCLVCGQGSGDIDFESLETQNYLYKIVAAVGDEKDIVLAMDEYNDAKSMLKYFIKLKEERGFRLHVLMNLRAKVTNGSEMDGDRCLLKYLKGIGQIDSVAFFNRRRLEGENTNREKQTVEERRENSLAIEEIFAEEVAYILTLIRELRAANEAELWLYDWDVKEYELIHIENRNLEETPEEKGPFQNIAPNDGKETCKKLRALRDEFRRKYGLKLREEPCTYKGECKGSCSYCEGYASRLWAKAHEELERYYYEKCFSGVACISGISRLREDIDGPGIRTLVVMNDCHMRCKYCINKDIIHQPPEKKMMLSEDLYSLIEKDNLYFEMTGGGVTFGGGEPLINPAFIGSFKQNYPHISVAVETSLNVPYENVAPLVDLVDYWIVDIKDMNGDIYYAYTKNSISWMKKNLKHLVKKVPAEKLICRVPLIHGFNTEEDVERSVTELKEMGVMNVERLVYKGFS